jgi:hypothetical protein
MFNNRGRFQWFDQLTMSEFFKTLRSVQNVQSHNFEAKKRFVCLCWPKRRNVIG